MPTRKSVVEKLEQGNIERRYGGQNIVSLKLLFASSFVLRILGLSFSVEAF
jgi:hypothetical protein